MTATCDARMEVMDCIRKDCENEYYPDPEKVAHITGLPLGVVFDLLIELKNQGCLGKRWSSPIKWRIPWKNSKFKGPVQLKHRTFNN